MQSGCNDEGEGEEQLAFNVICKMSTALFYNRELYNDLFWKEM